VSDIDRISGGRKSLADRALDAHRAKVLMQEANAAIEAARARQEQNENLARLLCDVLGLELFRDFTIDSTGAAEVDGIRFTVSWVRSPEYDWHLAGSPACPNCGHHFGGVRLGKRQEDQTAALELLGDAISYANVEHRRGDGWACTPKDAPEPTEIPF
jgi:hypothetical protein